MSDPFAACLEAMGLKALALDLQSETPNTLSYQLASFVAHVAQIARIPAVNGRGERLDLHVGASTELDGNAFAMAEDGVAYIGITFGHFLSSAYYAIEAFFRTSAFTDIGVAPDSDPSRLELWPERGFWDMRGVELVNGFSAIQSTDKPRIEACYFLTYAITMLAYFHEYFHVMLGHCPVMNRLGLRSRMLEVDGEDLSDEAGPVSRALEAVADRNAMVLLLKLVLADADLPTSSGVAALNKCDRIRLVLVGAGLLTASWFAWRVRSGSHDNAHPVPSVRFKQFFSVTRVALQELGHGDMFEPAGNRAMVDLAEIGWRCPELVTALWSISYHSLAPGDLTAPVSDAVAAWLDEETFRST